MEKLTELQQEIWVDASKYFHSRKEERNVKKDEIVKKIEDGINDFSADECYLMFEVLAGYENIKYGNHIEELRKKLKPYRFPVDSLNQ